MPQTRSIECLVNNQAVELGAIDDLDLSLDFVQNEPENWMDIQSNGTSFTFPCTKLNDQIFNTYHNPNVLDLTPGQTHRNLMPCLFNVNGTIPIMKGQMLLNSASFTDKPGNYNASMVGGNGDWIIDGQNITLWDCLSNTPHTFDVATIENSWKNAASGGYDSDEDHDFVYAPVRYRAPWQYADPTDGHQVYNAITIYMLRPCISIYWLLIRFYRSVGKSVKSQFLETAFFRRQVMPWTWGDFFDINNQVTEAIGFKAAGIQLAGSVPGGYVEWLPGFPIYFSGTGGVGEPSNFPDNTGWKPWGVGPSAPPSTSGYIFSMAGGGVYQNFVINNTNVPDGYDNFTCYSFDDTTGTMQYTVNIPPALISLVGSNISLNFQINLICQTHINPTGNHTKILIEITKNSVFIRDEEINELTAVSGADAGSVLFPTAHTFTVSGVNEGDVIQFRLKYDIDIAAGPFPTGPIILLSSMYENVNPNVTGASNWQYDSNTQKWGNILGGVSDPKWQPFYSSISMVGMVIELGNPVNFKYYDSFKNYKILDLIGGLVDAYDLEISTNPIDNSVTIEPFGDVTIPDYDVDGHYIGDITLTGYYNRVAVNDFNNKVDFDKESYVENFANATRQIDYSMKQDGSDGAQNIWSARYKGIYLNNVVKPVINNLTVDNYIIAGVPGASRYMLPNRFAKGNTQKQNRFFSATMHYKDSNFGNIGSAISPQFICLFPDNTTGSSASAITQVFQPKLAFYKGNSPATLFGYGVFHWVGDPLSHAFPAIRDVPFLFGVNYISLNEVSADCGQHDPVLSYSDQLVYDDAGSPVVAHGLMRTFHLPRLAIMRNGQLLHQHLRLNLNDICNFGQRNCVTINGGLYAILAIKDFKPLKDDSCEVDMWKVVPVEQTDIDNSFPSNGSVLHSPLLLDSNDLRYAQLLLKPIDIPPAG